ncbi:6-pyruvoyl tetrahydropterin synthase family protein [Bacteroidota bacterium]
MKVAKEFKWEMGHRLPFHDGLCQNLHGHSYKLLVEFTGKLDDNGIVIDYYDIKNIVGPIIERMDHSILVSETDTELLEMLKKLNSRHVVIKGDSTAENICIFLVDEIKKTGLPENVSSFKIRVFETKNTYAEEEVILK